MKQNELLHKIDEINLKISSLNKIVVDFESDKKELLLNCKHKDGSGNKSYDLKTGVCWICERQVLRD